MMNPKIEFVLQQAMRSSGRITVLTGAGISAESGIPTFRGPEGYWTVGSREYHPQEMATHQMFVKKPDEVWKWYLYRLGVCRKANPNAGHYALVRMEKHLGDRFTLITQNVDGLHLRAGSSIERTFQIHGNIAFMRCSRECAPMMWRIPDGVVPKAKGEDLTPSDRALLICPNCGATTRPHVLWFDEAYDEGFFRFYSSLKAAQETDLLITVGTSGATNLPNQVAWKVKEQGKTIIDINIEENPFSKLALSTPKGGFIRASAATSLPEIAEIILKCPLD